MSNQITISPSFPPRTFEIQPTGSTLVSAASLEFPAIGANGPLDCSFSDNNGNALGAVRSPTGGVFPLGISTANGLWITCRTGGAVVLTFE